MNDKHAGALCGGCANRGVCNIAAPLTVCPCYVSDKRKPTAKHTPGPWIAVGNTVHTAEGLQVADCSFRVRKPLK